jgi:hypothetical protein
MDLRSMLFVPGDSERKLAKGESCGADALVLDLEDSVPRDRIETARSMVREFLGSHRDRSRQQLWVRVNPLSTRQGAGRPRRNHGQRAPRYHAAQGRLGRRCRGRGPLPVRAGGSRRPPAGEHPDIRRCH